MGIDEETGQCALLCESGGGVWRRGRIRSVRTAVRGSAWKEYASEVDFG